MSLFSKTYELSLTRNYVSRWGMAQAVRELIQNALDSESPFVFEFQKTDAATSTLMLRSEFSELKPSSLLLGATSKADDADSIGSFGEGYKIALLVLTRIGRPVELHNGDRKWAPRFEHSAKFGEELLVVDDTALDYKHKGLTIYVGNLDTQDVNEVRASCIQMQDDVGEIKRTPFGDILLGRPGRLYVGGLFVCETEMVHGYNVKPEHLKLERDRQTVDGWDLASLTSRMWIATENYEMIVAMVSAESPDVKHMEYSSTPLVREACFQHFIKAHPGKVIANSDSELKALVEKGMTVYVGGSNYYSNVRQSPSYPSYAPQARTKPPHEYLEEWFKDAKRHMHHVTYAGFRDLIEKSKTWKAS